MGHQTTHACLRILVLMSLLYGCDRPVSGPHPDRRSPSAPADGAAGPPGSESAAPAGPGAPTDRVALVIGNADYKEAPLRNPLHDAQDMAHALRDLRFEVIGVTNATKKSMLDAVNDFGVRVQQAHVGLFYYAGHGVQYHGKNYLIPLQTTIKDPADLEQETVDTGRILGRMEQSQSALNIVILDACRNNPFRNLIGFRSYGERGLTALAPPIRGSLIAYATQPDNVAKDGTGRNSPYTQQLLRYLMQPNLSLPELFNAVGVAVSQETKGKQVPWMHASPLERFCFAGCDTLRRPDSQLPGPGSTPSVSTDDQQCREYERRSAELASVGDHEAAVAWSNKAAACFSTQR